MSHYTMPAIFVTWALGLRHDQSNDPSSYQQSHKKIAQIWWRRLDSNQRRHSQRVYSPSPLATRALLRAITKLHKPQPCNENRPAWLCGATPGLCVSDLKMSTGDMHHPVFPGYQLDILHVISPDHRNLPPLSLISCQATTKNQKTNPNRAQPGKKDQHVLQHVLGAILPNNSLRLAQALGTHGQAILTTS